jgi:hypothetical protein
MMEYLAYPLGEEVQMMAEEEVVVKMLGEVVAKLLLAEEEVVAEHLYVKHLLHPLPF